MFTGYQDKIASVQEAINSFFWQNLPDAIIQNLVPTFQQIRPLFS